MSTSRLKTIILRFRDLSIADTIFEHNKIIGENHFVWWGWWAKPQETIPFKEFGQLNSACKEVGLQVFCSIRERESFIKHSALRSFIKTPKNAEVPTQRKLLHTIRPWSIWPGSNLKIYLLP